jgi:hypothetical protein
VGLVLEGLEMSSESNISFGKAEAKRSKSRLGSIRTR